MPVGKFLIVVGIALVLIGLAVNVAPRIPWLGRLPGDIFIQRKDFTFVFPLTTCLIVSVLLTLLLNLFFRR